jgi:CheY-like chemotaxis protein
MVEETRTALGSAHERFVRGLPERGRELRDLYRALEAMPQDARLVEQLRRRVMALYASAQVFQQQPLLERIERALAGLEAVSGDEPPVGRPERDAVLALCQELGAPEDATTARPPDGERVSSMFRKERWSGAPLPAQLPEAAAQRDSAVALTQSVFGTVHSPDVIAVLVLAGPDVEQQVRAALPAEQCELTSTSEAETALAVIDQVAPDVVLIEAELLARGGEPLCRALRGTRGTIARIVVALLPEGASEDDALWTRSRADAALRLPLARTGLVERLLRLAGRGPRSSASLDALDAGTVDEIARSLGEEVRRGIADSLRQGKSERIEIADKAELLAATWSAVARIRSDLARRAQGRVRFDEAPYAGGPAALALTGDLPAAPYVAVSESVRGRRILLVDDDPAVVWFFAGLLREAGAIAIEASNGREALELARRRPPDLLISDILMPEIDGFTLCRELKCDLSLCHVPVILLSWKEDFLQRMRELDAGASGYLRKEAGSLQILSTVAEALRPRAELAALLVAGDEVQGRVEALGVPVLLQTVAAVRPDARIVLRDAWNLFEIDLRDGSKLSVTRTASDGSFARGPTALRQLLGVEVGRYAISRAEGPLRGGFAEPLDKLLSDGVERLGAMLDAVSDSRLMQVSRVRFDDETLGSLLSATPTPLADVVARLRANEPARALLLGGAFAPRELEQHLRELARRGALLEVLGAGDEDLIEAARVSRRTRPGDLMHAAPRPGRISEPPQPLGEADIEWVRRVASTPEPSSPPRVVWHAPAGQFAPPPPPASQPQERNADAAPVAAEPLPRIPEVERSEPFSVRSALLQPGSEPPRSVRPGPARDRPSLGFALTLAALVAVGFFGFRWVKAGVSRLRSPAQSATVHARLPAPAEPAAAPAGSTPARAGGPELKARSESEPVEPGPSVARVLPFVDRSRGVSVGEDQGLLVVEYEGAAPGAPPQVRVASRDLGPAPVAVALAGGRHEVMLKRGDRTSFRYVVIRAGETRIIGIHE